jgi:hypothetical protein
MLGRSIPWVYALRERQKRAPGKLLLGAIKIKTHDCLPQDLQLAYFFARILALEDLAARFLLLETNSR